MEEIKAWKVGNTIFEDLAKAEAYDFEQILKKFFHTCFEDDNLLDWSLFVHIVKTNKSELIELLK